MENVPIVTTDELRKILSSHENVNVIDIRPISDRQDWFIPGSIHVDTYDKLKKYDTSVLNSLTLDKSVPVVTVCGGGRTSLYAAEALQEMGYKASSLKDGMKGWSLAWNTAYEKFDGFELWQIRRTGKGCLSYIIASNKEAAILDASLPVEVYSEIVDKNNLSVKYVFETHIHADHLSRSKQVAEYFNAPLHLPANNKVQFEFLPVADDDKFLIGSTTIKSISTPGHTNDSVCYFINEKALITGDTLFTNAVGRPDLKSNAEETEKKAHLLYSSIQKLLSLKNSVVVLPAHANKPVEFDEHLIKTTIEEAKENIPVLKESEKEFVESILSRIPPTPENYLSIVERNILGDYSGINVTELEAGANRCAIS